MAKRIRVEILEGGAKAVLSSGEVQSWVRETVDGIAARANSMEGTPIEERAEKFGFTATTISSPHSRAGGRVYATGPSARRRNAKNNTLLKAMGGGA